MLQSLRTNFSFKFLDILMNVLAFVLVVRYWAVPVAWALPALTCVMQFLLGSAHALYTSQRIRTLSEELKQAASVIYRAFVTVFFILFMTAEHSVLFRQMFLMYFVLTLVLVLGMRAGLRSWLSWRRNRGHNVRRTLIIGTGSEAMSVTREINSNNKEWGAVIVGYLAILPQHMQHSSIARKKICGTLKDLADILRNEVIDDVLIAASRQYEGQMQEAIKICEAMGVNIKVKELMSIFQKPNTKIEIAHIGSMQCLSFTTYPARSWGLWLKRLMDIILSLCGLLFLIPLVLLPVALLIKLTSRGPIFFLQERVGMRNRLFKIIKFRTMVINAEALKAELMSKNENKDGITFKMKKDPRLTKIGGFLRRTSIDELPQLFNVLLGNMSLVGPRPPLQTEVKKYTDNYLKRLAVRPGITGLWQISGRSEVSEFDKWVALDARYIDTWSFWQDILILMKTIPVVLLRKGAY